jgi:tetratricopeptide (TPR) repeat protein
MRTTLFFLLGALAWSEDRATRLVQDLQRYTAVGDFFAVRLLIPEAEAEVQRRAIGDPKSVSLVNQIGLVQQMMGQYMEAEQTYSAAIHKLEHQDPQSPGLIYLLLNLAHTHIENCDGPALSESLARRALSLAVKRFGSESPKLGIFLFILGAALQQQGHREEALKLYKQALGLSGILLFISDAAPAQQGGELDKYLIALLLQSVGLIEAIGHQWQDAAKDLGDAIALHIEEDGPGNPNLIRPYLSLVRLHILRKEWTLASGRLAEARQIAEAKLAPNHPIRVDLLSLAAEVQRKMGQTRNARDLERQARELRALVNPGAGLATVRVHVADLAMGR